ncbi:GntR family transcriptional regulator [Alisedimentitalea sp. MJ-SS2]|uniref:GntR family transcriptional regulator n=1 Tax=Aliisedimentitalea sp. MJ-SS2 TaxID=3049795 RepID=UPI002915A6AF|nr:GntR family transcriptional regulator [Alisedimentitalea sp. MJ-SS2]MDU8925852.1 GntR family transcriptional regulator [Alisedimentitalea sp. MJ-SS2]
MTITKRRSWQDVRDEIHGWILDGQMAPGDRFERDEDIATRLGCSRATVQRAMGDLAERGVVERRRKGGTRVRPDPVTRATFDIPIARHEVEARGGVYGYQLIQAALEKTPRPVAAALDLRAPVEMLRVEALHLMDGRVFLYEDRWVFTRTVPEILTVDLSAESANEWLVHNKPYSACDLHFSAQAADGYLAGIMGVEAGAALFVLNRTTWSGDAPITTVKAVHMPGYRMVTRV